MKRIERLFFLVHGFCHAEICYGKSPSESERHRPFLQREMSCAATWTSRLKELSDQEALVIIPWPGRRGGPASEFNDLAAFVLGDRCFLLDAEGALSPQFWTETVRGQEKDVLNEIAAAFLWQKMAWNKEELYTSLHCLACCRQFCEMLQERDIGFDAATVSAEGWGASFEGCVTKYTLNFRRMLRLSNVVDIAFALTVPDARFLLDAQEVETLLPKDGLRLFLFKRVDELIGLYTFTSYSTGDVPGEVRLRTDPKHFTVVNKQGFRLWPQPADANALPTTPPHGDYYEPPQPLVSYDGVGLRVPITAGVVYRLAKAPAYIFGPKGMPYMEFRDILASAERLPPTG